jgi:hypothetical protein
VDVDYAWVPMDEFEAGQTHRLSLTKRLGFLMP